MTSPLITTSLPNYPLEVTFSEPQAKAVWVIIVVTICQVVEITIMAMVLSSSWRDYRTSNRSCSLVGFCKSLATMRKCFIASGSIIVITNTAFWIQAISPLQYNDAVCTVWLKITGRFSYSLSLASVYFCLWIRQYLLHSSPVLRASIPNWFYILSKSSLVLSAISFLLPFATDFSYKEKLNWGPESKYRNGSCYIVVPKNPTWFPMLISGLSIVTQFCYMILFYKTLKLHQENNKNATSSSSENRLNSLAKRCFSFTMVTVVSDCLSLAIIGYAYSRYPQANFIAVGKIDLAINMVCLVFCFNKLPKFLITILNAISCGRWSKEENVASRSSSVKEESSSGRSQNTS